MSRKSAGLSGLSVCFLTLHHMMISDLGPCRWGESLSRQHVSVIRSVLGMHFC